MQEEKIREAREQWLVLQVERQMRLEEEKRMDEAASQALDRRFQTEHEITEFERRVKKDLGIEPEVYWKIEEVPQEQSGSTN